jgi:hypothetical protein
MSFRVFINVLASNKHFEPHGISAYSYDFRTPSRKRVEADKANCHNLKLEGGRVFEKRNEKSDQKGVYHITPKRGE